MNRSGLLSPLKRGGTEEGSCEDLLMLDELGVGEWYRAGRRAGNA